jgi:hypothetical protein
MTTTDLDAALALADEAEMRFTIHFERCPSKRDPSKWCRACESLDLEARTALLLWQETRQAAGAAS